MDPTSAGISASTPGPGDTTVGEFLEEWLESIQFAMRPLSWKRYCQYVRLHAVPAIGDIPLNSLTAKHLQALYAERLAVGRSPKTVLELHRTLHRALGAAELSGLVRANIARQANPPRPDRFEVQPLSPDEVERFLVAARGDPLEALFTLAVTTGMRQGELLGLRWRDIDLERATIRITGSIQRATGRGLVRSPPKTRKSRRQVLLTGLAVAALHRHTETQKAQRLEASRWYESDFVFTTRYGKPIYASEISCRSLPRVLGKARLRHIRFHDLRHTTATLLLGEGVHPKIVSEMLGHSNIGITLDLYSHATPTMQGVATAALDKLLRSPPGM